MTFTKRDLDDSEGTAERAKTLSYWYLGACCRLRGFSDRHPSFWWLRQASVARSVAAGHELNGDGVADDGGSILRPRRRQAPREVHRVGRFAPAA